MDLSDCRLLEGCKLEKCDESSYIEFRSLPFQ